MKKLLTEALEFFVVVFVASLVVGCVTLLFFGLFALLAMPAKAQDSDRRDNRWATQRFCAHYDWTGHCTRYRYERRRYYRPILESQYRQPERVYSYQRRYDDNDERARDGQMCRDMRRAVGDQHLTVDGAKKAANDAWAGTVRFHIGEKWMDLSNAKQIVYTCSRSSIKEGGTTVTTGFQQFNRCELEAVPCSPVRQREEER